MLVRNVCGHAHAPPGAWPGPRPGGLAQRRGHVVPKTRKRGRPAGRQAAARARAAILAEGASQNAAGSLCPRRARSAAILAEGASQNAAGGGSARRPPGPARGQAKKFLQRSISARVGGSSVTWSALQYPAPPGFLSTSSEPACLPHVQIYPAMVHPAHALHPPVDRVELLVRDRPPPRHAPEPLHRIGLRPGGGKPLRPYVAGVVRQAFRRDAGRMPRCPVRRRPEPPPFPVHFFYDPGDVRGRALPDVPDHVPSRNGYAAEQVRLAAQPVGPAPDGGADGMPRPPAGAVAVPEQALAGNAGAGSVLFQLVQPLRYAVGPARHVFPARPVGRRRLRLFVRPAHGVHLGPRARHAVPDPVAAFHVGGKVLQVDPAARLPDAPVPRFAFGSWRPAGRTGARRAGRRSRSS